MIPLHAPEIGKEEQIAVKECLESGWISSAAPQVSRFESLIKEETGSEYVVALQSGTAALHLALLSFGIGNGDQVMVSDLTFVASANSIKYVGAEPILVDVNEDTWQMDIEIARTFLRNGDHTVKAIILVHILGYPSDSYAWKALADEFGLVLIEDAAGAIGSRLQGRQVGTIGDCGIISFNGNKLISTGGGGALLTNLEQCAMRVSHLANQAKVPGTEYFHDELGYNYRLTGLSAALGIAQLGKLPCLLKAHAQRYERYEGIIKGANFPKSIPHSSPNHWLTTAKIDYKEELQMRLATQQIQVRSIWIPLHLLPAFKGCTFLTGDSVSNQIYDHALSFPSGSGIEAETWEIIEREINRILG